MIVVPYKFVFVHIPRTGGMALTRAVASCVGLEPEMIIDTASKRHAMIGEIGRMHDIAGLEVLTVSRSVEEICKSTLRLIQRETTTRRNSVWWRFCEQVLNSGQPLDVIHREVVCGLSDAELARCFAGDNARVFKHVSECHEYISSKYLPLPPLERINC